MPLRLPYLAAHIDELARADLGPPAGWDAVAVVLALSCGPNVGSRAEREIAMTGDIPILTPRWHNPLQHGWIWLPPRRQRHAAFEHLGAGATVLALVDALERYKPDIRVSAKALCREGEVR